MKVSFVIPAYNEEKGLGECLDSVEREISASTFDAEIIVVDNASTDQTAAVAASHPRVRLVREPRKGLVFARAAGFAASEGDLIANVDADTRLTTGWLPRVVSEFEKDPRLAALSGPFIYYNLSAFERMLVTIFYAVGFLFHLLNQYVLRAGAMLQGGNFILRRDALIAIGGYDTSIPFYGEDTDIARRISKVGKVKWTFGLPMLASGRRLREEGIVRTGVRYAANFFWTTFRKKPLTLAYTDVRAES